MTKEELKYWVGLSAIKDIGPVRFKKIINYFSSLRDFFSCGKVDLLRAGLSETMADKIISSRGQLDLEAIWQRLKKEEIQLVTFLDPEYPALLKEIYDFPPILYLRGAPLAATDLAIAVVGTRLSTAYGEYMTNELVRGLVQGGVTVVSGLARGIDSSAHQATLRAGGKTVAVLGSGLDWRSIYPRENKKLVEEIMAGGGTVISEFPCGMPPHRQNFPLRNRLLSGLSRGVLVVEAGEKSGALITAKCALDQNREVFAVPGDVSRPTAFGPNFLIKQGARAVTEVNDILEALNLALPKTAVVRPAAPEPSSPEEAKILSCLSIEPTQIDQLILQSGLASQTVSAVLAIMEMAGKVKEVGGQRYVIK
ncbi:MAG: DNA-processing protein DprA [Patescibacteria group bacterium]|jgi:DNA processing protein